MSPTALLTPAADRRTMLPCFTHKADGEADALAAAEIGNAILATPVKSMEDLGYKLGAAIAVVYGALDPDHAGIILLWGVLDDFNALQEEAAASTSRD